MKEQFIVRIPYFVCFSTVISLSLLMGGFQLGILVPLRKQGILNDYQILFTFLIPLSATIGIFSSGYLMDWKGRRFTLILSVLLFVITPAFQSLSWKTNLLPLFVIAEFVVGFAGGMANITVPLYGNFQQVREIVPNELSGQMGAWYHCLYELGFLQAVIVGLFVPDDYAYLTFFHTEVFALTAILLLAFKFKAESPTYLWLKGKKKEALEVCNTLYFNLGSQITADLVEDDLQEQLENISFRDIFTQRIYQRPLYMCSVLGFFQQMTGFPMIYSYFLIFSRTVDGLSTDLQLIIVLIVGWTTAFSVIFYIESKFYLETGRLLLLKIGSIGMTASYIGIILYPTYQQPIVGYIFVLLIVCSWQASLGPILWLYSAELLSIKGYIVMCTINWLSAFIILLVSGFIIEMPDPSSNLSYLSIAFLVLSVIQSVFIFTQLFDTTGLNNKEIEQIIITGRASGNLKMSTTLIQTY